MAAKTCFFKQFSVIKRPTTEIATNVFDLFHEPITFNQINEAKNGL